MKLILEFICDDGGATMMEYALLVILVGVAAFAAVNLLGVELEKFFTTAKSKFPA